MRAWFIVGLVLYTITACATPPTSYRPRPPQYQASKGQITYPSPTPVPKAAPKIEYIENNYYYYCPRAK